MAYDHDLADRVRELVAGEKHLSERTMFGGLAFLLDGNMAVAASGQGGLMVRVAPEDTDVLTGEPGVEPMVMRGRELRGWLRVDSSAVGARDQLERWVGLGVAYARSLPAKTARR
ncbi:TfoX/Sxy family protein [Prauserella flavalba]|uniref:RNA methyltransferase n=1 Tax=Prauserella flavalba TaxID=1477506 RepID=A0A318LPM5_9PSEU|nr:TfoX/Sxy family protein [Prauserella flavalba]PXY36331.1 RNA methyltransferase [Prauserella flavalba]